MKPYYLGSGLVAPLLRENIDTDAILPKQYMKSVSRHGFGQFLFDEWRYLDTGYLGIDCSKRPLNPRFVLNDPRYADASVLLTGRNFGCGSSREHAPWALAESGFTTLIAPSFADIFRQNCLANGILTIALPEQYMERMIISSQGDAGLTIAVDLAKATLVIAREMEVPFEIEALHRERLLKGYDPIAETLTLSPLVEAYEFKAMRKWPWLQ